MSHSDKQAASSPVFARCVSHKWWLITSSNAWVSIVSTLCPRIDEIRLVPSLYFLPLPDISMTHLTDVGRKNDLVHLTFSETNESLSECSRTSSLGHCIVLACGPKYAAFGLVYFFVVWLIFCPFLQWMNELSVQSARSFKTAVM